MRAATRFVPLVRRAGVCGMPARRTSCSKAVAPSELGAPELDSNARNVMALDEEMIAPFVSSDAYVAPSATVVGNVMINTKAQIMNNVVARGDTGLIQIGLSNVIEEHVVLLASPENPTGIQAYVRVGMGSVLDSCTINHYCKIGPGCVLEPGSELGIHTILEPKTVVPRGVKIPEKQVWGGNPAAFIRNMSEEEVADGEQQVMDVEPLSVLYRQEYLPYGAQYLEKEQLLKQKK
ncbi:Gamma carbonic anhydrase-like 1, mitochondrial [Porphyridium purpureum]|uniref:Gamma carbonic anhydrase-like 1, mitochondrial n=1 Tax=Porphyridium purpureum TaxID=35688 RepID=A0A5J4YND8_PORPP|nr:Gamma carbonic anhydrase-like 1, mitochondrial [Porphyridium purpureum]|eukprot:POR7286..scf222_8